MINYLLNCFLFLIPILIWNIIFTKRLPNFYSNPVKGMIVIVESILRAISFLVLLLMPISFEKEIQKIGFCIYLLGTFIYFLSWIMQIYHANSKWSKSTAGILAPAYTAFIWFVGIGLIGQDTFISFSFFHEIYYIIVTMFVIVHTKLTYKAFTN